MSKTGQVLEQISLIICLYIISYQLIILIWGNQGLLMRRRLLQTQQELEVHYEQLQKHQRELLTLSEQIRSDPSYITIEARGLGYYQQSDRLILVNTWSQGQPAPSPGTQLNPNIEDSSSTGPRGIVFYALLVALSLWFFVRLLYFGRGDILPKGLGRKEDRKENRESLEREVDSAGRFYHTRSKPAQSGDDGLFSEPYFPRKPGENSQ